MWLSSWHSQQLICETGMWWSYVLHFYLARKTFYYCSFPPVAGYHWRAVCFMPSLDPLLSSFWWVYSTYSLFTSWPHVQSNHTLSLPVTLLSFKAPAYWPLRIFLSFYSHMHMWVYALGLYITKWCTDHFDPWLKNAIFGKKRLKHIPADKFFLAMHHMLGLNSTSTPTAKYLTLICILQVWVTVPNVVKAKCFFLCKKSYFHTWVCDYERVPQS